MQPSTRASSCYALWPNWRTVRIATWDEECDKAIYRLLCYIHTILSWRQVGYVGDPLTATIVHLCADADFAGDSSKKPRSGVHLVIRGPYTNFPINGQSKRQERVSHSTLEAEIVAADLAARREGIPALDSWDVIALGHGPLFSHEDNETNIPVCRSGRRPTMRHLLRSHSVWAAFLKEVFDKGYMILQYAVGASSGGYLLEGVCAGRGLGARCPTHRSR